MFYITQKVKENKETVSVFAHNLFRFDFFCFERAQNMYLEIEKSEYGWKRNQKFKLCKYQ